MSVSRRGFLGAFAAATATAAVAAIPGKELLSKLSPADEPTPGGASCIKKPAVPVLESPSWPHATMEDYRQQKYLSLQRSLEEKMWCNTQQNAAYAYVRQEFPYGIGYWIKPADYEAPIRFKSAST